MKFDWQNCNTGGKVIFIASCVATLSLFMKWVDIGFASQTGLSQDAWLFLPLWIYPVIKLLKNGHINRMGGLVCSIGSVIASVSYISSKSIDVFGETVNVAATGAYVYLLASIALIIGVVKYRPHLPEEDTGEQVSPTDG